MGRFACLVAVCAVACGSLFGWTDTTRQRMAGDTIRLLPPALSRLLARHIVEVREGCLGTASGEPVPDHMLTPEGGGAGDELERLVRQTIEGMRRRDPIRETARRMGAVCHLVADLNHPMHTAAERWAGLRGAEIYADYDSYTERVSARVPLVFYGWTEGPSPAEQTGAYAAGIAARSALEAEPLYGAYFPSGKRVLSSVFDDRSIPFAIASLSYSRAVSDSANLLTAIWRQIGGDLRGTPYMKGAEAEGTSTTGGTIR